MIMEQEQSILQAKSEFDQMVIAIHQAAAEGQRIDLAERNLWQRMLADIAPNGGDGVVDLLDLAAVAEHWREGN
jgi:hypothetical protein